MDEDGIPRDGGSKPVSIGCIDGLYRILPMFKRFDANGECPDA